MNSYPIKEIVQSSDRYKIFALLCAPSERLKCIQWLQSQKIPTLNIGLELARFVKEQDDHAYLNIDVYDFLRKLLENSKVKVGEQGNDILAIYNLGMLFEPALELNPVRLLREYSKTAALIIIWDNQSDATGRLFWPSQQSNAILDFTDAQLKLLQYEI